MSGPLFFDRVKETTTTTGTGTITLAGAVYGFRSFAVVGDGNTCCYCIEGGSEWEVGIGTYTASGTTLARTTVLASSNAGSAVNFSAGTKNVFLTVPAAMVAQDPAQCCGRLTLESGVPVSTSDQTGKTNIYFTPFRGNRVALYNGYAWVSRSFSELTLALGTVTSGANYDVFLVDSAGTLTLEKVAWTNDTTRATALALQDGVYVKSGDATRRYLGTFRTTGTTTTEDSAIQRFVFNNMHRVRRSLRGAVEATNNWGWATAGWHQANANAANKLQFVTGLEDVFVSAKVMGLATAPSPASLAVGLGLNSTSDNSSPFFGASCSATLAETLTASYEGPVPQVGYNYIAWLEYGSALSPTFYGDAGVTPLQSGLSGWVET